MAVLRPSCIEPAIIDRAAPRKEEARRGILGYGDFDTVMDVVAKAVSKGPYLLGQQFHQRAWSSGSWDCAGACCSSCYQSGPNSSPMSGAWRHGRRCNAPKPRTRSLQRRKQRAPRCSAGEIPKGIFSRISLAPHRGYPRVQMILALRILDFEDLSVGMTGF